VDLGYFGDGAQLAADLVNTKGSFSGRERLLGVEEVRSFMEAHGQSLRVTKGDVAKLQALRARLREVFAAGDDDVARRHINALLADYPTQPQLTSDGERGVTFMPAGNDVAGWIGASAALGLAFFVAQHGTTRLGMCDASDCNDAYIDASKNTNKRYCSSGCARLESVRAFRQRKRTSGTAEGP
jgi:predicted RNA-binding Zn ribbon-like protein